MIVQRHYLKEYFPQLGEDCDASVDCYIPMQMEEMKIETIFPCMIICPGGAYAGVSEREGEPVAMNFISEGYAAFVVHYSVAPKGFPQQLREVAAVMELLHKYAKEWHCDANNVAIMGFSAGGHLAAQYSNRYDCPEIRELFSNSKPVQKTILGYPVITSMEEYTHDVTMFNFVGHKPGTQDEKGCSCELLVSEKTPPTFLWHTAADRGVPVENSLLYAKSLAKYNIPFELHVYPYGWHGLSTVDERINSGLTDKVIRSAQWIDDCKRWLKL